MKYIKECRLVNYDEIKYLIDSGVIINQTDKEGQNALFYCFKYTYLNISILDLLLQSGIDVNCVSNSNQTPLFETTYFGYKQILLDYGADVNHSYFRYDGSKSHFL